MGDEDAAGAASAGEEGEEDTSADADSSTEEDAEGDDGTDDDADDEGDGNEPDNDGSDDGDGDEDDDDGDEPPVRKPKTAADFVALRRGKKLAKVLGKGKGDEDKGGAADEGDEEDDGLAPEDAAAIDRRVAKAIAPVLAEREQKEVETEIATFVTDNPKFKPFAAKAAKWAKHDAYKNLPVEQLMYAAAGKHLMRIGAAKGKEADSKARKGRTGGGSDGGGDRSSKDWHGASHEDVGKEIERVKMGGR